MRLGSEMSEGVDALTNKMETFKLPLIVETLEFNDPFEKILVCKFELLMSDLTLVDDSDGDDQLTIMLIVRLWKYPIE